MISFFDLFLNPPPYQQIISRILSLFVLNFGDLNIIFIELNYESREAQRNELEKSEPD